MNSMTKLAPEQANEAVNIFGSRGIKRLVGNPGRGSLSHAQ